VSEIIVPGQRWMSEMEPELGLGVVKAVEHRRVLIRFEAAQCERMYATDTAPIRRVRFHPGDKIRSRDSQEFTIIRIEEKDNRLIYICNNITLIETDLNDSISFTGPEERLMHGQGDPNPIFNLRQQTLKLRHDILKSPVRGLVGARIDLIPHQLYIVHEIVNRHIFRALLADEVGLGKTIEACLIMHRLLISGRINRVLILVPDALVNQWFVELLRRFNLMFRIIDEDYCFDVLENDPDINPFADDALILCSVDFLAADEDRRQQAITSGWDMLIVDEAHHLQEGGGSYALVEELAKQTPGLLLLTATPEQLGLHSHFERLKLLDRSRYYDYEQFRRESDKYHDVAIIAGKLLDEKKLTPEDEQILAVLFANDNERLHQRVQEIRSGQQQARQSLLNDLLDRHGLGRVMFRNTRTAMQNFPKRKAHPVKLESAMNPELCQSLVEEFSGDGGRQQYKAEYDFNTDPRLEWLAHVLKEHRSDKVLLICRTRRKAQAIFDALQLKIHIKAALFHENLTLIQRDRNAAWFSEKDGARILICSEIGSEGRNFQFAHHLVLFDLPVNPELLEQRIGRLDRIGQKSTIHIHIPYIPDTPYAVLFRWYHEGLNAFEKNVPGAQQVYEKFKPQLWEILKSMENSVTTADIRVEQLIADSRIFCDALTRQLESGRDRLLELHSCRTGPAEIITNSIDDIDRNVALDDFMQKIFDFYGIVSEDVQSRTYHLMPGDLKVDAFPGFRGEEMSITFDRAKAMAREDIDFITIDHPMVTGSIDLLLGSEQGNCAFAVLPDSGEQELLLEAVYLLECIAPPTLHIGRFLPATPVRIVVNEDLQDCSAIYSEEFMQKYIRGHIHASELLENEEVKTELLPAMLKHCLAGAKKHAGHIVTAALNDLSSRLGPELDRLRALQKVNDHIHAEEIVMAEREIATAEKYVKTAQLRLDSLRLVIKGKV